MSEQSESKMDKMTEKAQDALAHFFDDPEKVEKAKGKAEGLLAKHMDEKSADQVVDNLTNVLRSLSRGEERDHSR